MTNYKDAKYQFPASSIISGDISAARMSLAVETKPVVSSVAPTAITNDAQNIVITGTDFVAIPRVDIINTATGIWYSANTVTRDSATQLTVNLTLAVDAGTYRIRVENPDGMAGLSAASFLTVSDAPVWTTGAGSLGTVTGDFSGTVATVAATGDTVTYSETTSVLTNASLANCTLNSSTGVITTSDFDGSSTTARTHTFTIRATDAQSQTTDREFTLTSSYTQTIEWLVIAGGGSGGTGYRSGGGGAGGYRNSYASEASGGGGSSETAWVLPSASGAVITVTVGAKGDAPASSNTGTNGGNSTISSGTSLTTGTTPITSIGGGGGGEHGGGSAQAGTWGSGGGYGNKDASQSQGGTGTAGQGYNGGGINMAAANAYVGGGGGGAGSTGWAGGSHDALSGDGGTAMTSSITGTAVARAGGGGAGGYYTSNNAFHDEGQGGGGGAGDGGTDHAFPVAEGDSAVAASDGYNSGSGGGGSAAPCSSGTGDGDDGIVILRVPTSEYSGTTTGSPTVLTDGSHKVLVFQSSGSYTTAS